MSDLSSRHLAALGCSQARILRGAPALSCVSLAIKLMVGCFQARLQAAHRKLWGE